MPDPTFAPAERRSFLIPILLALAALAAAFAIAMHFFPSTSIDITHLHTELLPTETVFKGSTIIGRTETSRILFVASTLRIDNQLRSSITLDGFDLTLTAPDDRVLTAKAVAKSDLPGLEANFPALKPLLTHLLEPETAIEPNGTADGTILYSLSIPQSVWDTRTSAVLKVSVYHQPDLFVTIPKEVQ